MMTGPVRLGLIALFALPAGCTSWERLPNSRPVPARGTVQIWSGGRASFLRSVQVAGDSLVGRRPLPDTSSQFVSLRTIDSVRIQTTDLGKTFIVGSGVGIMLLLVYLQGLQGLGS
jgi:hypothetical protein